MLLTDRRTCRSRPGQAQTIRGERPPGETVTLTGESVEPGPTPEGQAAAIGVDEIIALPGHGGPVCRNPFSVRGPAEPVNRTVRGR